MSKQIRNSQNDEVSVEPMKTGPQHSQRAAAALTEAGAC